MPPVNRTVLLGLVILAASAAASVAAQALAATHQGSEANAIAWIAWWAVPVGFAVCVLGVLTGGLFGLLRDEPSRR